MIFSKDPVTSISAVHGAIINSNWDALLLLVENGANMIQSCKYFANRTAFEFAIDKSIPLSSKSMNFLRIFLYFLSIFSK